MEWQELLVRIPTDRLDEAAAIANMTVPYGIYIEDYSDLEKGAEEIAHINLIDEDLIKKDRKTAIIHIYFPTEENITEATAYLCERLNAEKLPFEIEKSHIAESDWRDNWKKYFKVTEIGERLVICPSWERYQNDGDRKVLTIDPGAAFGTGTHATTRLCLELLEEYANGEVLDIGCGSGILSIGAILLGAEKADGVDIDATAVKVAKENAEINGVQKQTNFIEGDLLGKITGRYDLVCANIVADVIIGLSTTVQQYMKPDALFLCSGIIDSRADEVEAALKAHGFKIKEKRTKDGWFAFAAAIA